MRPVRASGVSAARFNDARLQLHNPLRATPTCFITGRAGPSVRPSARLSVCFTCRPSAGPVQNVSMTEQLIMSLEKRERKKERKEREKEAGCFGKAAIREGWCAFLFLPTSV